MSINPPKQNRACAHTDPDVDGLHGERLGKICLSDAKHLSEMHFQLRKHVRTPWGE